MCTPPVWRLSRRSEFDTEIDGRGTSTDRGDAPLERDEGVATFATSADVRLSVGVIERETNRATSLGRPRLEMKSVLPQ